MTENQQAEKYTSVALSPDFRVEVDQVVAATGATRSTINDTISEWVEANLKGKVLSLYLERVARRAGALSKPKPPIPRPRRPAEPIVEPPAVVPE